MGLIMVFYFIRLSSGSGMKVNLEELVRQVKLQYVLLPKWADLSQGLVIWKMIKQLGQFQLAWQ